MGGAKEKSPADSASANVSSTSDRQGGGLKDSASNQSISSEGKGSDNFGNSKENGENLRFREEDEDEAPQIFDIEKDEKRLNEAADFLFGDKFVSTLRGNEFHGDNKMPLVTKIKDFYDSKYGGNVDREGFGSVRLGVKGIKDSLHHLRFTTKSVAAFAAVPEVIRKGVIIDQRGDWKGRGYETTTFAAPIKVGKTNFIGVVIVKQGERSQQYRFYLHKIVSQKYLLSESPTRSEGESHQEGTAKLLRTMANAKKNRDNLRKNNIQGENGGNLRFREEEEEPRTLVGVHNISEESSRPRGPLRPGEGIFDRAEAVSRDYIAELERARKSREAAKAERPKEEREYIQAQEVKRRVDAVARDDFDTNSPWWRTIKRDFQNMLGERGCQEIRHI